MEETKEEVVEVKKRKRFKVRKIKNNFYRYIRLDYLPSDYYKLAKFMRALYIEKHGLIRRGKKNKDKFVIQSVNESEFQIRKTIEAIVEYLRLGNELDLRGLGKFKHVTKKGKVMRNPKNGELVEVGDRTYIKFDISDRLKRHIYKTREEK